MLHQVWVDVQHTLFGTDEAEGSRLAVGASAGMLLATIGAFLFAPAVALPVLAGFVIITAIGWITHQGAIARLLTLFATVLTVLTVFLITVFLFVSALPAFTEHGSGLLLVPVENGEPRWFFWLEAVLPTSETFWNPLSGAYSLIPAIWATVIVTFIAGAVAIPLGLFGALFILRLPTIGSERSSNPASRCWPGSRQSSTVSSALRCSTVLFRIHFSMMARAS